MGAHNQRIPSNVADVERQKYSEIWSHEEYAKFSPGLANVAHFMRLMKPERGAMLIDIGCGAGAAGLEFERLGLDVTWLDLVSDALAPEVNCARFIEAALWDADWPLRNRMKWDYGFCCDVLEHIPPEFTMLVIDRILSACRTAWLQIALRPDEFGKLIGQPLHLTVQPYEWWLSRIASLGEVVEARDLCGTGLYVVRR